jgi:ABC-2 type transport system ATP-binding protein
VLKLCDLNKSYGSRPILQNLNLKILPGEIYGLLGPNGAGKTTTINLICYFVRADSGTMWLNQQPLDKQSKFLIGVAPQENLLYDSLTCTENLSFFARLYGLSRLDCQQRVQQCLEAVGLSDRATTPVEHLSGGMLRRMNIAIALIHQPKLLILDEPTTGLDIEARYQLWNLIRQLQKQGMTILLTTHLLEEAERLCQRIGILKGGSIVAEGTLAELRQLIAAQEVVMVQTAEETAAITCAQQQGLNHRRYGNELAFWLPDQRSLQEIILLFDGIPLDSIARQPVRLEHIYLEVTQGCPGPVLI